jgi:hypothetical protein
MTAINEVTDLIIDGEIAIITLDYPPVNALSPKVLEGSGFRASSSFRRRSIFSFQAIPL